MTSCAYFATETTETAAYTGNGAEKGVTVRPHFNAHHELQCKPFPCVACHLRHLKRDEREGQHALQAPCTDLRQRPANNNGWHC